MQVSLAFHSISMARVSQRLGRLAASFQSSIHGIDALTSDAPWIRAELAVAVRTSPEPNTATMASGVGRLEACTMDRAGCLNYVPTGLPNIPLTAFQSVRPGLGGPERATRTGTLARFKMSRVKSPMM